MSTETPSGAYGRPMATSTVNRKKHPNKQASQESSLGLLSLAEQSVDLIPVSERKQTAANVELQRQRELSRKSISRPRLSSRYFKPSELPASFAETVLGKESTVSESDLLRSGFSLGQNGSFQPAEISTPRESLAKSRWKPYEICVK